MSQVIVRILPDGKVEVKVAGVGGAKCTDVTKALEKALGSTVSDKKTDEYYKTEAQVHQQQKQS